MFNYSEHNHPAPEPRYYYVKPQKEYGFFNFVWDSFMLIMTCGLWLIWIFVREMRRR